MQQPDGLVAQLLLLAYRVLGRPAQQHGEAPRGKRLVAVAAQHVGLPQVNPAQHLRLVARGHVEVDAGQVALPLVGRLKDVFCVALNGALAHLAVVRRAIDTGLHLRALEGAVRLAVGQVAAHVVDVAVGGNDVYQVADGWLYAAEPALRKRVFAVQPAALVAVLVGALGGVGRNVRVDVPQEHLSFHLVHVGDGVRPPQVVIRQDRRALDDVVESGLQCLAVQSVGAAVIVLGSVRSLCLCGECYCEHRCRHE